MQVFDPAFVHVGDNCGASDGNANTSLTNAATLAASSIPGYTAMSPTITPATRYAPAGSSAFCSGDNYYGDGGNTANPWTTWSLRAPDVTTWDPTNNPIICQAEFPGVYPETSNDQPNGTVSAYSVVDAAPAVDQLPRHQPGKDIRFVLPPVGDPVQRQQSGVGHLLPRGTDQQEDRRDDRAATVAAPIASRSGSGNGTNYATTNGLHVYGNETMGAYANATGANTQFYLTRVLPGEAGKTLILNFFDTGDASQAGTLAVLPPADSNVTGGAFTGCQYTQPPGNATGPPWGTFSNTATGCKITGVSNSGTPNYNGQWVAWQIPIPATYTCDDAEHDRLLGEAAVHLPGRHHGQRHHDLVRVHPRRARPHHQVARVRAPMGRCRGATPATGSSPRRR